jgi:hypothetical protein
MIHSQIKIERWQCLPTAFAMALDTPVADILKEVGHDGGKIAFRDLPEPMRRRGFHVQELIDVCLARGYAVTLIELFPAMVNAVNAPVSVIYSNMQAGVRFTKAIFSTRGVMEGRKARPGSEPRGHALAYDHGKVYDPDGGEFDFSLEACEDRFLYINWLWRLDRII